jgi:hypothetical protein
VTQPPLPLGAILGYRDACDHGDAEAAIYQSNNGVGMWCPTCRTWVTNQKFGKPFLSKEDLEKAGVDRALLRVIGTVYRKCQGACGQLSYCDEHHVAPRAFFGDECDQWPKLWLCKACHHRWHSKVTPGLCTPHDPEQHARMLIDYLGLERASFLTRALTTLGKALRAGAA